jgi:hypothetical protein
MGKKRIFEKMLTLMAIDRGQRKITREDEAQEQVNRQFATAEAKRMEKHYAAVEAERQRVANKTLVSY